MKLKELVVAVADEGIIPFRELQIKMLDGEWKRFMRMRVGPIRVIFQIHKESDELFIYEIDFRGGVY